MVVVGACLAALNDLRPFSSKSDSPIVVEQFFEAPVEVSELGLARVDPVLLVPSPSTDAQLAILRADKVVAEIRLATKSRAAIEINYSSPKFTIVDSLDEVNNRVSFLSTGTASFSYSCVGDTAAECDRVIQAFVVKTEFIRRAATKTPLVRALTLLDSLIDERMTSLNNPGLKAEERLAEANALVSLRLSRSAISLTIPKITGRLIETSRIERPLTPISHKIRISSLGFGGVVGLILGLLLVLQLGVMDSRIRFATDVAELGKDFYVVGSPTPRTDLMQIRSVASTLIRESNTGQGDQVVIPFGNRATTFAEHLRVQTPALQVFDIADERMVERIIALAPKFVLLIAEVGKTTKDEIQNVVGLASLQAARTGVVLI